MNPSLDELDTGERTSRWHQVRSGQERAVVFGVLRLGHQRKPEGYQGRTYVSRLVDYFQDYKSTYDRSHIKDRAKRGDYVAISTKGDDKKDHSAMFLAYDEATKMIWTLEGNWGNEVVIEDRYTQGDEAKDIAKLGGIVSSMVK